MKSSDVSRSRRWQVCRKMISFVVRWTSVQIRGSMLYLHTYVHREKEGERKRERHREIEIERERLNRREPEWLPSG